MTRIVAFMCLALAVSYMPVLADEPREVFEIEIDAGVDEVWDAFTTTPGIKSKETWTVFYFAPVSTSRTKITVVGLGYTDSEQSQKMRSFFDGANEYSLKELEKALIDSSAQPGAQE